MQTQAFFFFFFVAPQPGKPSLPRHVEKAYANLNFFHHSMRHMPSLSLGNMRWRHSTVAQRVRQVWSVCGSFLF
jgi:hypothetical protein